MIIAFEKLTKDYQKMVKDGVTHIGEGFILDRDNKVLLKFNNVNDIDLNTLRKLKVDTGEIVVLYPCNIKDKERTLEVCVESYIIREGENFERIFTALHSCSTTIRHINEFFDKNLKEIHLI